ncbi:MAG: transcriptional repressor [Acidimicrobiales bacterium]
MRTPQELTERYRCDGRKVTPQRLAVFEALHGDRSHPTAEVVWDRVRGVMPSMSLRTVYQVLNDLVELGEVNAVDVGSGPVRFDPNVGEHDHFVCERCGRVVDVQSESPVQIRQPDDAFFVVDQIHVIFRGACPDCAREAI